VCVEVPKQGDLGTMVDLLVDQDGDDLAGRPRIAQVAWVQ